MPQPIEKQRVSVFGASSTLENDPLYADIQALGKVLGTQGWNATVGGHQGLMGAFSKGMEAGGGAIRGITLSRFPTPPENALSEEIRAYDFFDRMRSLIEEADAWLVLPGGLGTLAEFAMCWDLLAIRVLKPRPLLVYGAMWQSLMPPLRDSLLFSMDNPMPFIYPCNSPEEVLKALPERLPKDDPNA
ncbi:MAG: LOG family protein [Mariprofundaceae bacterium]|nr:LOG family protein [Mariprofundaceae bacterium]